MKKQCRHISLIITMIFSIQIMFSSGIFFIGNYVFAEQTSVEDNIANSSIKWTNSLHTVTATEFAEELPPQLREIYKSNPKLLKLPPEGLRLNDEQRDISSEMKSLEIENLKKDQLALQEEKVINKIATYMGEGTSENPYQIWTAEDLNNIRHDLSAHYIQMENIDLSGYSNWQPIENFTGVFDGNNKRIFSLTINRPMENSIGLFGRIINPAELKNIKLENIDVTGNCLVGGLVGENGLYDVSPGGNIDNVYVSGSVTGFVFEDEDGWLVSGPTGGLIGVNLGGIISRAHSVVNVNAGETCGGLVGLNVPVFPSFWYPALISDSYATGNVTLVNNPRAFGDSFGGLVGWNWGEIQNSYAAGNVYGKDMIGGLVGNNDGVISNSYATGNVTAIRSVAGGLVGFNTRSIDKCYSTGWIDEGFYTGGLVGYSTEIIYDSYYNAETSGQSNTGNGERRTTAQMKDINTFIGWDFENVWNIDNYINDGYPFLRAIPGTPVLKDITGLNAAEEIAKRDPAQISPRSLISDPIDTSTGAQIIDLRLLTIKGAQPIVFSINYNSLLLKEGSLGKAWNHPFEVKLEFLSDDNINVLWNQNRKNLFLKESEDKYSSEDYSVRFDTLTKKENEGYELAQKDKTTYLFDSTGKLTEIINPNKFSIVFYYDETNRLKEIIEPISNKKLILFYDDNNLIEKVTDSLDREVLFQYDANKDLTAITESTGAAITYTYNSEGQIVSATDLEGKQFFENTFDEHGRIISQKDGLESSQPTTFVYDELAESGKIITTVTNRDGNQKVLVHDSSYRLIHFTDELNFTTDFEFDIDGNLISEADTKGNATTYTYDEKGNLLTITNALGNITRMTYDENDNLLSIKNEAGGITSFTYDSNQRLIRIQDALGNITSYTYDENGLLLTETSSGGAVTNYTYTEGLLHTQINSAGDVLTYNYDVAGRLISISDAAGTISMTYDNGDRISSITDPLNNTIEYTYDLRGNKIAEKDSKGNTTTYTYNDNDLLISMKNALNHTIYYEYDGEDRLKKIIDAKGKETTFIYDVKGQMTGITNPLDHTFTTEYDEVGNVKRQKDALGNTVSELSYDAVYNLIAKKDALGSLQTFEYDKVNNLIKAIDPLNRISEFHYDALGRMISALDALNGTSAQQFDGDGNRITLTDPNQNTLTFNYNQAGQLISVVSETGNMIHYQYNERNLLEKTTNSRGQEANYTYNAAGQLTSLTDNTDTVNYTYDANGNILTITNNLGTIECEYDTLDRLVKYTDVYGNIIRYAYDANNNLTALTYPDNRVVNYSYDDANRLIGVTDWNQRKTIYTYNENNQLLTTTRPNGSVETRTYNTAGRLTALLDVGEDSTVINHYTFDYDAVGNIIEETNIQEQELTLPEIFIQMTYNETNQLATYNEETVLYDQDNNMTWGPLNNEMATFHYDSRNRLIEVGATTYEYDANNNRIAMTEGNVTKRYVVNPNAVLSQILMEKDQEGNIIAAYVYGLGLISRENTSGEISSYHYDLRGSTVALTDIDGNQTDQYVYDSFGELVYKEGGTENPFLYNGRDGVATDNNGLYYMRTRYYNPEIRRFMNEDNILGFVNNSQSLNRFAYVQGNPINYIDPEGLFVVSISGSLSGSYVVTGGSNIGIAFDDKGKALIYNYTGGGVKTNIDGGLGANVEIYPWMESVDNLKGWSLNVGASWDWIINVGGDFNIMDAKSGPSISGGNINAGALPGSIKLELGKTTKIKEINVFNLMNGSETELLDGLLKITRYDNGIELHAGNNKIIYYRNGKMQIYSGKIQVFSNK